MGILDIAMHKVFGIPSDCNICTYHYFTSHRGDIHATIKWLLEHIFISANPNVCMGRYQCSGISMWKLVGIPTIAELHLSAL